MVTLKVQNVGWPVCVYALSNIDGYTVNHPCAVVGGDKRGKERSCAEADGIEGS